jgi:hypothetical protein
MYERLSLGAAAKADKFIGAFMPDVVYGSGVPAIVCLVAAARLDPVGESVSIRHRAALHAWEFEGRWSWR